ncbi:putative reverse transcriptase domain-containing protein [Tanacetum coccineum]
MLYANFQVRIWLQEVQFLGHVVNRDGIHVDPSKVESVKNWKTPELSTEIRSFLGLAGYYRWFIENFSKIAKPLTLLTQKNKMYVWGDKQDEAIPNSEEKTMQCHVLALPDELCGLLGRVIGAGMKRDLIDQVAHFLPIREDYKTEKLAKIYTNEIVARHGVPVSIISDRDGRFTSHLWQAFQEALGTRLDMSTAYHPQTDGQKLVLWNLWQVWDTLISLIEFSYNNSYHTSIKCAPFEALYGRKCRSPVIWTEVGESQLIGPEIVQETTEKIFQIKERLKTARSRQKSYADKRRKPLEFEVGDRVLLKVSPWKGVVRFGKKGKLAPRYVGPFEIIERVGPVAYRLKLPQELSCVHDTFHVSNLKKCLAEPDVQVPLDEIEVDENH